MGDRNFRHNSRQKLLLPMRKYGFCPNTRNCDACRGPHDGAHLVQESVYAAFTTASTITPFAKLV
jgi:hypothetical protein